MNFYQRMANLAQPEQVEAMVAELADRFGSPPDPVAHLLALVRLKTEASVLGYESLAARDGEMVLKLRRTVAPDRVGLYKRYRNDATIQLGEIRIPRRRFSDDTNEWLAQLRELLPLAVGKAHHAAAPTPATGAGAAPAPGPNGATPGTFSSSAAAGQSPQRPPSRPTGTSPRRP
jgi:transcription-repair coupling factor (superfamily II helicase)